MGCGSSIDILEESRKGRSNRRTSSSIVLLLLGISNCGKSTLAKQFRLLHMQSFSDQERKMYINSIHLNVVNMAVSLAVEIRKDLPLQADQTWKRCQEDIQLLSICEKQIKAGQTLMEKIKEAIKNIWENEQINRFFNEHLVFKLPDSTAYYMENLERISCKDYVPTDDDILRSRVPTQDVIKTDFSHNSHAITLYDVGGLQSERRKWLHLFDNVTAVLFVQALPDYDLASDAKGCKNRLEESLEVFSSVAKNEAFKNISIIIFHNKVDVFRNKLSQHPLSDLFPSYTGDNTFEDGCRYIGNRFADEAPKHKEIYSHFTIATDVSNVQIVFEALFDIIMKKNLDGIGLFD